MKQIVEKMLALRQYYEFTRQAGHTTLLKEGLNNFTRKKLVLAYTKENHTFFNLKPKNIVSWHSLNENTLCGHDEPLAIDNGVMYTMLDEALKYIGKLEDEVEESRYKLNIIKRTVNENRF